MLFAFGYNDLCDLDVDRGNPRRRAAAPPRWLRRAVACFLAGSLALCALLPARSAAVLVALQLACAAYSHPTLRLKTRPGMAQLVHFAGAAGYYLAGRAVLGPILPPGDLWPALYFGLACAAGGLNNELADHDYDAAAGARTTAVRLGKEAALSGVCALLALAVAAFSASIGQPPFGFAAFGGLAALLASAAAVRRAPDQRDVLAFRGRYRLLFGALTAVMVAHWARG